MIEFTTEETRIKDVLTQYSLSRLTTWWCTMNCFRWPADFPMEAPRGSHFNIPVLHDGLAKIMNAIIDLVGMDACLQAWNDSQFALHRRAYYQLPEDQ